MKRLNAFKHFVPTLGCAALVLATVLWPLAQTAQAQSTQTPWQNLTPSKMTAVWWEWALGVPVSSSPWFDPTGANAFSGQPYFTAPGGDGDLLFLAGTFVVVQLQNGDVLGQVTRSVSLKEGTALFFPLLNTEYDDGLTTPHRGGTAPPSRVVGVPVLEALAIASEDSATNLYATVTPTDSLFNPTGAAVSLSIERLTSSPFHYTLPATDNILQSFGYDVSGVIGPAVSEGYWSSVPGGADGLASGYYALEFGGESPLNVTNKFTEVITYHLTVTP